mgnify:CR=1 FL=1
MPRKPFQMCSASPYHLSARSNGRDWFAVEISQVWEIMSNYLHFTHHAFNVRIHAFVLMSNHFHLIASFPDGNLSQASEYFMRETSRSIARESGRINHVYGARIFRSRLGSRHYFEHTYKYVYRNPISAGLCTAVENYDFSTLRGLIGNDRLTIPVDDDCLLFDKADSAISSIHYCLGWLNTPPDQENHDAVRRALRNPDFRLPKQKSSRRRHRLEQERL